MAGNKKLNTKATGIIAVAVICSRLLGLVREVLFNDLFGAASMGIFLIAFRAPNLLRDLFAEGALSIAFITVFSKKLENKAITDYPLRPYTRYRIKLMKYVLASVYRNQREIKP